MYNKARVGAAILDRWSGPWDFFSSKFRKSVSPPPPASVERRVPVSRITPNKISFHNWVVALCSVTQPYLTLVTPWTVAHQAPLSMEFSRQEYWSGLPFPPPGDLPYPGTEPVSLMSPALADSFLKTSASWEAHMIVKNIINIDEAIMQPKNLNVNVSFIYLYTLDYSMLSIGQNYFEAF